MDFLFKVLNFPVLVLKLPVLVLKLPVLVLKLPVLVLQLPVLVLIYSLEFLNSFSQGTIDRRDQMYDMDTGIQLFQPEINNALNSVPAFSEFFFRSFVVDDVVKDSLDVRLGLLNFLRLLSNSRYNEVHLPLL